MLTGLGDLNDILNSRKNRSEKKLVRENARGSCSFREMRVSMGWWLLRLSAKILALLPLPVNFFQLRLTKKLKTNFFCFKELNINKPVFF